jgi:hypothetical protein
MEASSVISSTVSRAFKGILLQTASRKKPLRTNETRLLLGEAGTELAGSAVTRPDA